MNLPPIRTASPMTFERQYSPDIVHSLSPGSVGIQRRQSYQRGHSKPSPENSPNLGSPKGPSLRPFLRPTFDWRTDNELVPSYGNVPTHRTTTASSNLGGQQTSYPSSVGSHAPSQRPRPQDDNPDMRQPALLAEATCFSPSGPSFSYPVIPSEHSYAPRSEWSGPPCEPTLPNANPTPDNVSFNLSHNRVRERSRNNTEDERYLLLSHDHWVANIRPDKVWCRGCEGDIELDDREHQRYYTSGFTKHRKTCAGRILKIEVLCDKLRRMDGFPYSYTSPEIEDQYWKDEWSSYMKDLHLHARDTTPYRREPFWLKINREAAMLTVPSLEKRNVRVFYDDRVYVKGSYTRGWVPTVDKVLSTR